MVTIFSMNPGSSISFAVIPINREKKLHALRHIPVGLWLSVIQRNCGHFALKLFCPSVFRPLVSWFAQWQRTLNGRQYGLSDMSLS